MSENPNQIKLKIAGFDHFSDLFLDYLLVEEPQTANLLSAEQAECLKTLEYHSLKERVDYTAPKNTKQK